MSEFLKMGGYAVFVWPSYGLSALVLTGLLVLSWRGYHARKRQVEALEAGLSERADAEAPKSTIEVVTAEPRS